MRSLHIFRQDLRVQDNTSLIRTAAESKHLLPVFVFDTLVLQNFPKADKRLGFLVRALKQLQKDLQAVGSDLHVYHGASTQIIPQLVQDYQIDHVSWNRSYGYHSTTRDHELQGWCSSQGVTTREHDDYLLVEPETIKPLKVFTPWYRRRLREPKRRDLLKTSQLPPLSETQKTSLAGARIDLDDDLLDILERIDGADTPYWKVDMQPLRLANFDFSDYTTKRNRPDLEGTTRLSPYIRHGLLSPRQVLHAMLDTDQPGLTIEDGMITMDDKIFKNTYVSELAWREYRQQVAINRPESRYLEFMEKYRDLKWVNNKQWFQRRKDGTTGYPIVDAAMRQLKAHNRMHGRTRMIVASFLTKDLLIDWRRGEQHFKDYLLDYDTNVNIGNRQRSASTGADPKPLRIFNPILQSQKYDPKGDYIRQRVPELANCHDKAIHDPIKYTLSEYYEPIVDHYVTSKYAKEIYYKKGVKSEGLEELYH